MHITSNNSNHSLHHHHQQQHTIHLSPNTDRRRKVTLHRQQASSSPSSSSAAAASPEPLVARKEETKEHKKTVRFCEQDKLEQVRLFLKSQKPSAVRRGDPSPSSFSQTIELKYPNWPAKTVIRSRSTVRMESVQVVTDNENDRQTTTAGEICLAGRCRVANLAFEKHVVVRYTTDYWKSYRETEAKYREPIVSSANTWDRFTFSIRLENKQDSDQPITLFLALRYTVNDREFWDNNDGLNYQIDVIPRLTEDDDNNEIDKEPITNSSNKPEQSTQFQQQRQQQKQLQQQQQRIEQQQQQQQQHASSNKSSTNPAHRRKKLSHRYDFGASLSAAKKVSFSKEDDIDDVAITFSVPTTAPARYHHPLLVVDYAKQQQQREEDTGFQTTYHEFVNKYCFYGTTNYSSASTPPSSLPPPCVSPEPICG